MKTTLNIPEGLLKEAMRLADIKSKTEAVITALKEFVRQKNRAYHKSCREPGFY